MNTKLIHGIILGIVGIILSVITSSLRGSGLGAPVSLLFGMMALIAGFLVLWVGVRAVRNKMPGQCLTYGQGVGAGVLIVLVASVIYAVYAFVFASFSFTPDHVDKMIMAAQQQWDADGLSSQQMKTGESIMRAIFRPVTLTLISLFGNMLFGTIAALIVAAIVRRPPQTAWQVPPAPPPLP